MGLYLLLLPTVSLNPPQEGHFMSGLEEAVNFVRAEQPHVEPRQDYHRTNDENETSPNLDFDIDLNIEDIKLAEK